MNNKLAVFQGKPKTKKRNFYIHSMSYKPYLSPQYDFLSGGNAGHPFLFLGGF